MPRQIPPAVPKIDPGQARHLAEDAEEDRQTRQQSAGHPHQREHLLRVCRPDGDRGAQRAECDRRERTHPQRRKTHDHHEQLIHTAGDEADRRGGKHERESAAVREGVGDGREGAEDHDEIPRQARQSIEARMIHPEDLAQREGECAADEDADDRHGDAHDPSQRRQLIRLDRVGDCADHLRQRQQQQPVHRDRGRRADGIDEAELHEQRREGPRGAALRGHREQLRRVETSERESDDRGDALHKRRRDPCLHGHAHLHADEEREQRHPQAYDPPRSRGLPEALHRLHRRRDPIARADGRAIPVGGLHALDGVLGGLVQLARARAIDQLEGARSAGERDGASVADGRLDQQQPTERVGLQCVETQTPTIAVESPPHLSADLTGLQEPAAEVGEELEPGADLGVGESPRHPAPVRIGIRGRDGRHGTILWRDLAPARRARSA